MKAWKIKNIWAFISSLGIQPNSPLFDQKRIQLLNQVCALAILLVLPSFFVSLFLRDLFGLFTGLCSFSCLLLPIYLNLKNKYYLSRIFFLASLTSVICAISYAFGSELPVEYSYLTMAIFVIIFFEKKRDRIIGLAFIAIAFGLSLYIFKYISSPLAQEHLQITNYITYFTNITAIYFAITMFMDTIYAYAIQADKLLTDLQKQNNALETQKTKISKQNNSLEKTNNELEQANKELESFAYIASHDLKTPLRNTHSFLQLIERKIEKKPDKEISEFLNFCLGSTQHMQTIIEDILSYSKLNKKIELAPLSLAQVFKKMKKLLHQTLLEKEVILTTDPLPNIHGNESQFLLLFQNLIENGIKYNTSQPIELHIELVSDDDQQTTICFKDNGIGIAPEYQDQIFEMFKRLHTQKEYAGTGIGLATCYKIVSRFSGKIWVESEERKGSSFFVQIPKRKTVITKDTTTDLFFRGK